MTDTVLATLLGLAIGLLAGWIGHLLWRARHTRAIRRDAADRSRRVTTGKIQEQLVPLLPGFEFDPGDVRFLGSPVDLVIFDGLARGRVERVVFLEVKTGTASLTTRERRVREAVREGRVEWIEWRAPGL